MHSERRRFARHVEESLLLTLLQLDGGLEVDAFVRNLSLTGMMIEPLFGEGLAHLAPGVRVRCGRPPLHLDVLQGVEATVRWAGGETVGLCFDDPLPLGEQALKAVLDSSGIASWDDLLAAADMDPAPQAAPAQIAPPPPPVRKKRARTPSKRARTT